MCLVFFMLRPARSSLDPFHGKSSDRDFVVDVASREKFKMWR